MDCIEIKLNYKRRTWIYLDLVKIESHYKNDITFIEPNDKIYDPIACNVDPNESSYELANIILGYHYEELSWTQRNIKIYRTLHHLYIAHTLKTFKEDKNLILVCYGDMMMEEMQRIQLHHMRLKVE